MTEFLISIGVSTLLIATIAVIATRMEKRHREEKRLQSSIRRTRYRSNRL